MRSYQSLGILLQLPVLSVGIAFGQAANTVCTKPLPTSKAELRELLSNFDPKSSSEDERNCAAKLLDKLGGFGETENISALVRFIGLERPLDESEKKGFSLHPRSPSHTYPALGALEQIGPLIWPPLLDFIAKDGQSDVERHNAVLAILGTERDEPELAVSGMVARRDTVSGEELARIQDAINFALSTAPCKRRTGRCEGAARSSR